MTRLKYREWAGFTLIELLIVILIISIVTAAAVISININQNKKLQSLAAEFANLIQLAEQEAMLRPATLGITINRNNLQFHQFVGAKDPKDNPWQILSDPILGERHIPNDIQVSIKIQGKIISNARPQLIISPSGDITPFTLLIGKANTTPRYQVSGDANGQIQYGEINEEK